MNRFRQCRGLLLLVVLVFKLNPAVAAGMRFEALVVHIASGDTLTLRHDGVRIHSRLATIEAPEPDQPYGGAAKKTLGTLVFNRIVLVEVVDYDSMLVRVQIGGLQVDEILLHRGLAWVARPHTHNLRLSALQNASQSAHRGLWRAARPIAPWHWRAGVRI